jgi:single-strand DNA-binding protein
MLKVTLIGNLGRDPEMRILPNSGQNVTNFSVASTRKYTVNGETREETSWVRISAFGRLAEVCNQYLKKGSKVYVEGRLNIDLATGGPRVWAKQDGSAAASFEMIAAEVQFLSSNGGGQHEEPAGETGESLDIPF